jgi:hypothetical protein
MTDRLADIVLAQLLREAAQMLRLVEWDEQTGEDANRRILAARDDLRARLLQEADKLEAS